ncbi:hypothetical protein [Clostridium sp. UBA5988]|uniref:hypothetical protein n=1 Tax=Clostridium sp. UBA5988 TaxID=1946369 RepID=UPI003217D283
MVQINLLIVKTIVSNLNSDFKISSIYISYDELIESPNINDIHLKRYNGITFEDYSNGTDKFYTIQNSTTTSCEIAFNLRKELNISDTISIMLNKNLKNNLSEIITDYGTITTCLLTAFNNSGCNNNIIHYQIPSTPGNYRIQLLELNETDISSNNITSNIIKVVNPIQEAEVPEQPYVENSLSHPLSFQILNVVDCDNNLITANFITVLRVKVIQ